MRAAANGHAPARGVDDFVAALHQLLDVAEARGAVGVGKEHVVPAYMAQAVRHAAALAAVPLEAHDAHDIVQLLLAREPQHHVDRPVPAAVVDDEDLVARRGALRCCAVVAALLLLCARVGRRLRAGTANVLVEVLNRLFQGR